MSVTDRLKKILVAMLPVILIMSLLCSYVEVTWSLIVISLVVSSMYYYMLIVKIEKKFGGLTDPSKMSKEQEKMLHTQEVMLALSNSMIRVRSVDELLQIILEKAIEVIGKANYGSVMVLNDDDLMEFKAVVGFDKGLYDILISPNESYQWFAADGTFERPVILEDLKKFTNENVKEETKTSLNAINALDINSTLSAPILVDGEFFGALNIDSEKNDLFNEEDIAIMAYFANLASSAVANHLLYDQMLYLSKYDGLTGALNRYQFENELDKLIRKVRETGLTVTIVLIDLDRFKIINDEYGHEVGDTVLKTFAQCFSSQLDEHVLFSRYGGDEFAIAFTGMDEARTIEKMEALTRYIDSQCVAVDEETRHNMTFSYGAAEMKADESVKKTLRHADLKMYAHKKRE